MTSPWLGATWILHRNWRYYMGMAIFVELPPILEAGLRKQARSSAMPVDKFAAALLEKAIMGQGAQGSQPPLTTAQIDLRFRRAMKIVRECHALPVLDGRSPEEIIGYDDLGLPK